MSPEKYSRNSIIKRANLMDSEIQDLRKNLQNHQYWFTHTELRLHTLSDIIKNINLILYLMTFLLFIGYLILLTVFVFPEITQHYYQQMKAQTYDYYIFFKNTFL